MCAVALLGTCVRACLCSCVRALRACEHEFVRACEGVRECVRICGLVGGCTRASDLFVACAWMVVGMRARALVRHREELSLRSVFALPNVSRIGLESMTCGG